MPLFARQRKLLVIYRTGGEWFVVRDGRNVAVLYESQYSDMFWYSWKVRPISDDPADLLMVHSPAFWADDQLERTKYVHREFGNVTDAFWAPGGIREGRVVMRGLYLPPLANRWDQFVIWWLGVLGY